ncbi:polysaccharide deacetylase family protein [Cohnella endophytica]|uniref:Polysaccharide deacetylase family protein n=1 Tax=Cohnella endophytica TaxID=2419778 RepID=A0A494XU44_9BACL|nr:polysaccharide deacetylase family protein [Cohnella endophytica]RKP51644.1 polysaccharide deacetylase family protein [Cohnella endophytica]
MRGKRVKKRRRTLAGTLGFMLLVAGIYAGFTAKEWKIGGPMVSSVVDAAPPAETATSSPPVGVESPAPTPAPTPTPTPKPPEVAVRPPEIHHPEQYKNRKLVALTFDDGPDNNYTTKILDILEEQHVKATFFLVGTQVVKYPATAKRIVDEGHSIGNHSWSHSDLSKLSGDALELQIGKTQQAIIQATGVTPGLMRAPYGALSDGVLDAIHRDGMKHIYWTVDTKDWAGSSVASIRKNVLDHTHKGGIILMHSFGGKKNALDHTVKVLPTIIKDLQARGYELVTVDELIDSEQVHPSVIK